MDPEFSPSPLKTFCMRGDEINQQHRTNEMTAGKNWNFEIVTVWRPPNKKALEITLLGFVSAEMDLRQRAGKNQNHPCNQTNDCQLQRRDKIDKLAEHP